MSDDSTDKRPAAGDDASSTGAGQAAVQGEKARVKPWHVVFSTLAAGFGVQSSRNRERDFNQGKAGPFIVAGLVFTVLFVAGVALVVNLVLSAAG